MLLCIAELISVNQGKTIMRTIILLMAAFMALNLTAPAEGRNTSRSSIIDKPPTKQRGTAIGHGSSEAAARANAERMARSRSTSYEVVDVKFQKGQGGRYICFLSYRF